MKKRIAIVGTLGLGMCVLGATGCSSSQQPAAQENASVSANQEPQQPNSAENNGENNTAVEAGSSNYNSGAMQQGESSSDINITSQIRQRVLNQSLSIDAQNVTITTLNGHVTLRGRVDSQSEKDVIGRIAGDVAEPGNVDNQLYVQARE